MNTDSVYESTQALIDEGEDVFKVFDKRDSPGIPERYGYIEPASLTKKQLKSLKRKDSYGFKKLLAERFLREFALKSGL